MLILLLACTGKTDEDSGSTTVPCGAGPNLEILSPREGDVFEEGETVAFEAEGSGDGLVRFTWGVDSEVVDTGRSINWVAAGVGNHILTVSAEDDCGTTEDSLNFTVIAAGGGGDDTGHADDTGDDTGDTAPPLPRGQQVFDADAGVPVADWNDLDVAGDGTVWAAGSAGLVHLDPESGAVRIYTSADGLTSDEPQGVLAHSDGTVWIGHAADIDRQGEQVSVGEDGALTVLATIDYAETTEIAAVYRLREQRVGAGAGEVWMGTNEGLCVYDPARATYYEHAHPDHPHGNTRGVAISADGTLWNGDDYHLTRWTYAQDGVLSPYVSSANFLEQHYVWPVEPEVDAISIADLDADGSTLWVASTRFGVARVDVAPVGSASTTALYADPWPAAAYAIRVGPLGDVWIGSGEGLYRWDGQALTQWQGVEWLPSDVVQQLAVDRARDAVWAATPGGLVRLVGVPE